MLLRPATRSGPGTPQGLRELSPGTQARWGPLGQRTALCEESLGESREEQRSVDLKPGAPALISQCDLLLPVLCHQLQHRPIL